MLTLVAIAAAPLLTACDGGATAPSTPTPPAPRSATLVISFDENPVSFRSTGCNPVEPQGWYTGARIQETSGVSFTPSTLIQKVDGNAADFLQESFNSRFGACAQGSFTPGMIPANGAVCGVVGVCTAGSYSTYQFQLNGTDANGHSLTFESPILRFGASSVAGSARGEVESSTARQAALPPRFIYTAPR